MKTEALLLELPWSVLKNFVLCRWIWTEAGVQPELETMLEIGGFGYPAMAVMNTKKMKYSILRGSFSNDGINEFLR
jgi:protein disulfide-isomerase A6